MTFIWPPAFWLLLVLPPLVFFYLRNAGRRSKLLTLYPSLLRANQRLGWWGKFKRHVPPMLFLASLVPFVCSGVLMLRRIRHARAVHIVGWSLIYVSGFLVSRMNSGPSTDAWSYAAWGVAQTAAVAGYLYFSKRVRAYFSDASAT